MEIEWGGFYETVWNLMYHNIHAWIGNDLKHESLVPYCAYRVKCPLYLLTNVFLINLIIYHSFQF